MADRCASTCEQCVRSSCRCCCSAIYSQCMAGYAASQAQSWWQAFDVLLTSCIGVEFQLSIRVPTASHTTTSIVDSAVLTLSRSSYTFAGHLIRPELDEALVTMTNIYKDVSKHINSDSRAAKDKHPILSNLLILNIVHEREAALYSAQSQQPSKQSSTVVHSNCSGRKAVERSIIQQGARYCSFANAAYGLLLLKGLRIMRKDAGWPSIQHLSPAELNRWCIVRHTGIAAEDLVRVRLGSSRHLHMPGYYVAVDHADKSVVLALRGTASVKCRCVMYPVLRCTDLTLRSGIELASKYTISSDTITDLVCDSADFLRGRAHRGLAQMQPVWWYTVRFKPEHSLLLAELRAMTRRSRAVHTMCSLCYCIAVTMRDCSACPSSDSRYVYATMHLAEALSGPARSRASAHACTLRVLTALHTAVLFKQSRCSHKYVTQACTAEYARHHAEVLAQPGRSSASSYPASSSPSS
eukprot:13103-Heterococcus_DN1.PRE.2